MAKNTILITILLVLGNSGWAHSSLSKEPPIVSTLLNGHALLQLGAFWSDPGKAQHIDIEGLIGDTFTVTNNQQSNGLVGIGYYTGGLNNSFFNWSYGINGFYLAKTSVNGFVIQEDIFTNLAYHYKITHYPVYIASRATMQSRYPNLALTIDAGIGPNFMNITNFEEGSLDGITIPDTIFSSHSPTAFSATAGLGIKLHNVFGNLPLECGYRFFYLGQGHLKTINNQVLNNLNTGAIYANAAVCTISL